MIRNFELFELAPKLGVEVNGANAEFSRVSLDSRDCNDALFVAIKGERHDGHDFVEQACANDCGAVLIDRQVEVPKPHLLVRDTREALGWVANLNRREFNGKVVALTGSSGKTTTKNMLKSILEQVGQCLATPSNQNNEIGVPLTLLSIEPDHDFAVIEMGARKVGDIGYLAQFAEPDVVLVLNAGSAHIGEFGGYENIVTAKGELYRYISDKGVAILNMDDKAASKWKGLIPEGARVIRYSSQLVQDSGGELDLFLGDVKHTSKGSEFTLCWREETQEIFLPLPGEHNVNNALAAAAAAICLGATLADIQIGLAGFSGGIGRMRRVGLTSNLKIIDDTYNANPASMSAAISVLALHEGRSIAVLGDMAELGDQSSMFHGQLGRELKEKEVQRVFAYGPEAKNIIAEYGSDGAHFESKEELLRSLISCVKSFENEADNETTILFKGSRSMEMETIVSGLEEEYQ